MKRTAVFSLLVIFSFSLSYAQLTKWVPVTYTDNSTKEDLGSGGFNKMFPSLANVSGGYGISVPSIKNMDPAVWKGIHYREGFVGFSIYNANNTTFRTSSDTVTGSSKYFTFDLSMPLKFLTIGKRGLYGNTGMVIVPNIGLFYQAITVGGEGAGGFGVAPEVQVQLPYSLVSLKLNCGYSMGGGQTVSGIAMGTKGFTFFPQLSIQLDGLTAWHGIKKSYTGTTLEGNTHYDTKYEYMGGGVTKVTKEPMSVSYWTQDWHTKTYDPFYGLYIRGEMGAKKAPLPMFNYGVGLSSRRFIFMKDLYVNFGQHTTAGFTDVADADKPANDTLFWGTHKTVGVNFNLGVDAWYALKQLLFKRRYTNVDDGVLSDFTPYRSAFFYMGLGYQVPISKSFENPNVNADADAYFASHPSVQRNAKTDPTMVRPGTVLNVGMQIEVASLGFTFGMSMHPSSGVFVGMGFVYHLPVAKQEYPGWLFLWKKHVKKEDISIFGPKSEE